MSKIQKTSASKNYSLFQETFVDRHIGPRLDDCRKMLETLGLDSLGQLVERAVPKQIMTAEPLSELRLGPGRTEAETLLSLRAMVSKNQIFKSYIGMGYYDCITPAVIQRGILENPGWYTQYTPYQAEISQGRLEALLNFQTMVSDLTGLEIANASLLDEATAAAEAMTMSHAIKGRDFGKNFFVSSGCHPQTIAVVQTRAEALGIRVLVGDYKTFTFDVPVFGVLLQYPDTDGSVLDYRQFIDVTHARDALVAVAADILSLAILKPPGELGADIALGSTQRFGVPIGYGGPHAAYLATKDEYKRLMPGRIVGVSKDKEGNPAIRLSLQTREQHIRREKATSNICTAQVLLAIISSMYAVYHGPSGIKQIAERVHFLATLLADGLKRLGCSIGEAVFFDTLRVGVAKEAVNDVIRSAHSCKINLRSMGQDKGLKWFGISLDEATTLQDIEQLLNVFSGGKPISFSIDDLIGAIRPGFRGPLKRESAYLSNAVFNSYHSETEMLRYIKRLEAKDLSLTTSMIPLGSCTMKLNAASEMLPITWPELANIHPFAPVEQAAGYGEIMRGLEGMLAEITGFEGVSLQPNAGSQGEYAGLLVIRKYHKERGDGHRDVCLIPQSAHGTNPASAAMAGMKVVVVRCDSGGNIDLADLEARAKEYSASLGALMVTYPSTHGVFEESIREICGIVHNHGGQVYLDGANMNALVGLCRPAEMGADICHINLHKTFAIPHGGGGPGMGPIAVKSHLVPYLPTHPVVQTGGRQGIGPVAAAPWGSASILPISYSYIDMMGAKGLTRATQVAILNANYVAKRLDPYYPVLYKGKNGFVAHECIVDLRNLKTTTGVEVEDVAKRLMDYGFHAPTVSFPVPGTLMIEPTESESKQELDRFCDAMILIHAEISEIAEGKADKQNNVLKNAPHTAVEVSRTEWNHPYAREKAAFAAPWLRRHKFWPPVSRIDAIYGERNLVCTCPPVVEPTE